LFDRLHYTKSEIENCKVEAENARLKLTYDRYNSAIADYNESLRLVNKIIDYRNKQFIPAKADTAVQHMVDLPNSLFENAKTKLSQIEKPDANLVALMASLKNSMDDASEKLKEQTDFVKSYLRKNKIARKAMFYR